MSDPTQTLLIRRSARTAGSEVLPRLALLSGMAGGLWLAALLLAALSPHWEPLFGIEPVWRPLLALPATVGLALSALAYKHRNKSTVWQRGAFGLATVVLISLVSGLAQNHVPSLRPSWVATWVVMSPILVSNNTREAAFYTTLATLTQAAVHTLTGQPALLATLVPTAILGSLAILPVAVVQRNQRRLMQASERSAELEGYRLLAPIASGGMGSIWLAEHALLQRRCAVKFIISPEDPEERKRREEAFAVEARLTASLASPHTVRVLDFGIDVHDRPFLVMELLDGVDMYTAVSARGPMPADRVVPLLRDVLASLAEAHSHGLVHRDIKPQNLVLIPSLARGEFAKVLDFGIAQSTTTAGQTFAGTPGYMAPELFARRAATPGSDLYALGCTAYFLLTGRKPYEAKSFAGYKAAHTHAEPDLEPIPAELRVLLHRLLTKHPEERFESAVKVHEALDGYQDTRGWGMKRARRWWATSPHQPVQTPDNTALTLLPDEA